MNEAAKKQAINYGLIAALAYVAMHSIAYTISVETLVSYSLVISFIPAVFGFFVYGAFQLRRQQENVLAFRDALQFAFLAYVIFEAINAAFVYILYNLIDPTLTQAVFEATLERMDMQFEKLGLSGDQLDEALEKARKETPKTGAKEVLLGFGFSLIWSFIKSLAIALISRKEPTTTFENL